MATSKNTKAHDIAPEQALPAVFSPRAMVDLLFSLAGPRLSDADLTAIVSGGASYIELAAKSAAEVAEGIGCLVAADAVESPAVGSFQSGDSVAKLMWHMQSHLSGMASIASAVESAAGELAARAHRSRHGDSA